MQSPFINDFPCLFYNLWRWWLNNIRMDCRQLLLILPLHMLKLWLQKIDFINSLRQLLIYPHWTLFLLLIFCIQLFIITHQHLLTLIVAVILWLLVMLLLLISLGWTITRLCIDSSCVDGDFIYYMVWDECLFDVLWGNYCWHRDWLDDCFV